ncbi:hypothetical protein B0H19DRAFT_1309343 [Mycena capillaripes]|nr:hypothetical protein B0H19DRAFT_1309343 [Mycena capillaripes]
MPPPTLASADRGVCITLLLVLGSFSRRQRFGDIILCMPRARFMLAKAWRSLSGRDDPHIIMYGYIQLRNYVLDSMKYTTQEVVEEVIEGAGGSLTELATCVIEFIDHVLESCEDDITTGPTGTIHLLAAVLAFVNNVEVALDNRSLTDHDTAGQFSAALIPQGMIPSLTRIIYTQARSKTSATALRIPILFGHRGYTVLDHDFETARFNTIYPEKVAFMTRNPQASYFTLFDHTRVPAQFKIPNTTGPYAQAHFVFADANWQHHVARPARSNGRLQLDIEGNKTRHLIVPLRTESSAMYHALRRIAVGSPFAQEGQYRLELVPEIQTGLAELNDIPREIH